MNIIIFQQAKTANMRDTRSFLLLFLSIGLVGTWVYHLYDKTKYSYRRTEVYIKDSAAIADGIRDSLSKLYSTAINEIDTRLIISERNTDTLKGTLQVKINELNGLKDEINNILNNRAITKYDLSEANKKILVLQYKVNELKNENTSIKEETSRLNSILLQLNTEVETLQKSISRLNDDNKLMSEKINLASVFMASEVSLNAIAVKKEKEQETFLAKKTDKLVASFLVQNPIYDFTNTEVVVIVVQPDGQVLPNTGVENATFETKTHGTLNFTRKIKIDYSKGERRKIIFSLPADKIQKGNYQLQLWHKGVMIGQTSKTLS